MVEQIQSEEWLRQQIIDTALELNAEGLSHGTSGNVSARWQDGMLITPTGMPYSDLLPGDIVYTDGEGKPASGALKPSSEWRFHLAAYEARPNAAAVVHCHSISATALACAHKAIPAFHYMVAVAGGDDIPLAPYATFGSEELARNIGEALKGRSACLMANHGQIACAGSLGEALGLVREVEVLATQYIRALGVGEPALIDAAEMRRVLERFSSYGQQKK